MLGMVNRKKACKLAHADDIVMAVEAIDELR